MSDLCPECGGGSTAEVDAAYARIEVLEVRLAAALRLVAFLDGSLVANETTADRQEGIR